MYIAQAFKFKHEFWRYISGFFVVFIFGTQLIGMIPLMIALLIKYLSDNSFRNFDEKAIYTLYDSNIMLPLILFSFVIGFFILILWVKYIHKQPISTLYSIKSKLNWKKIWFSFILCGTLVVVSTIVDYYMSPNDYLLNFKLVPFLILFLIATILIPIQASFEEFIFRGYLMQGIGLAAGNKWMPLLFTSLLFGFMHILNPEVEKMGYIVMVSYVSMGLFFGIITLMDEGLELAIGYHIANNLFGALLVTADWTAFQTHSVFKYVGDPSAGLEIFIPVFIILPVLIFIFSKKYKWSNWKEKLFGKVETSIIVDTELNDSIID